MNNDLLSSLRGKFEGFINPIFDPVRKILEKYTQPQVIELRNQNLPSSSPKTGPGFDAPMLQPGSKGVPLDPPSLSKTLGVSPPSPSPVSTGNIARNPSVSRFKISPQVADAINKAAQKFQVNPQLLYDIALQESGFNPTLKNPLEGSTATGLFQFTEPTWRTVQNYANDPKSTLYKQLPTSDRTDPLANALAAAYLIKFGQLGRWDASKNIWGQYYPEEELKPFYAQTLNYGR